MDRIVIEPADNGYILRYDDPAIQAENRKEGSDWVDAEVRKVYPDEASMMQDLATILPSLSSDAKPAEEFNAAFNEAAKSE